VSQLSPVQPVVQVEHVPSPLSPSLQVPWTQVHAWQVAPK
jgi:hypothetical protein